MVLAAQGQPCDLLHKTQDLKLQGKLTQLLKIGQAQMGRPAHPGGVVPPRKGPGLLTICNFLLQIPTLLPGFLDWKMWRFFLGFSVMCPVYSREEKTVLMGKYTTTTKRSCHWILGRPRETPSVGVFGGPGERGNGEVTQGHDGEKAKDSIQWKQSYSLMIVHTALSSSTFPQLLENQIGKPW